MVKNNIRKSLLEQGLALSSSFISSSNEIIQKRFINYLNTKKIANILLYSPFKQEVALDLIQETLKDKSINVFLPKVFPNKELKFNSFTNDSKLSRNKYNIFESDSENFIRAEKLNLLVIPFVGVDVNGCRLGYGGGYYDRALESVMHTKTDQQVIGLGYQYQILKDYFGELHDIKYDMVFSENDIHHFG